MQKPLLPKQSEVPDFSATTQLGDLHFHDYISGSWCLFFSHPADFTPVCTTEFGMLAKLEKEFSARSCKIVGVSVDSVESHEAWIRDINETQETEVKFPVVADSTGLICKRFGMTEDVKMPVSSETKQLDETDIVIPRIARVLYLIDPLRRVQMTMHYPEEVGRNFYEIIRVLDALQVTLNHQVGTPANWKAGEDVLILPHVPESEINEKFPKGFTEIKPYLRLTPPPDNN